ncbi:MAG: hypothetical protein QGF53_06420 [Alphaproteobacteria bacterium]|jgi:hypothetical protein|nr:hypothetical protein [Alphaproteobacteria bacterium]
MAIAHGTDPVSAIAESEATGEVAAIFADIRATMDIPMLTSIWRTLVAVEGGLPAAWQATKPLYLTGQPAAALARVINAADLPTPAPLVPGQLAAAGVPPEELAAVRAIVAAYNRSNGMNMIALTALLVERDAPVSTGPVPSPPPWPELRPLLAANEIDPDCWDLLCEINTFGGGEGGLATLWRHLAHWPGLLALIHAAFSPLQQSGALAEAMQQVHDLGRTEAAQLAHLCPDPLELPDGARRMISDYVAAPTVVARMVTLGHILGRWLEPTPRP